MAALGPLLPFAAGGARRDAAVRPEVSRKQANVSGKRPERNVPTRNSREQVHMSNAQRFRNGVEFPNEGFVQNARDRYFADLGFTESCGSRADIDLRNPTTGVRWVVEAKGDTKQNATLDFKTGLG